MFFPLAFVKFFTKNLTRLPPLRGYRSTVGTLGWEVVGNTSAFVLGYVSVASEAWPWDPTRRVFTLHKERASGLVRKRKARLVNLNFYTGTKYRTIMITQNFKLPKDIQTQDHSLPRSLPW